MFLEFLLIIFSAVAYAFFSGIELAYASSNKLRLELQAPDGHFDSRSLSYIYGHQGFFLSLLWMLSVVSLLVYFISVFAFSATLYPLLNRPLLFLLSGIISLVVLVIVADVFLKLVFHFNPTSAFRFFSFPLYILTLVSKPFLSLSSKVLFNMRLKNKEDCQLSINRICRDKEYSDYCKSRMQEKDDDVDKEVKMFQNALDFSNVLIKDCIVPRTEIIAIDVESSVDQLKSMFVQLNYSRILVYKDNIDNIVGYVHSLDMFDHPHEIKDMLNPLPVVQENMPANRMLKIFLQQHKGIALVVDEFGGTSGIVTLEDIMEEIFGEIEDEHDEEEEYVSNRISKNEYLLSGRLEIEEVNEAYNLNLPLSDEYSTIAGLLLFENSVLPSKGSVIKLDNYEFSIIKISYTRIELVRLKVKN